MTDDEMLNAYLASEEANSCQLAAPRPRIIGKKVKSTYTYEDEDGTALYTEHRLDIHTEGDRDKQVWFSRPDGSKGIGERRVLYQLPRVRTAKSVLIVEGSKK